MAVIPQKKIANLDPIVDTSLTDNDVLPIVSAGVTWKVTLANLALKIGTKFLPAGATVSFAAWILNSSLYNVKNYGALGDGATNDSVAINAAITAAGINGVVFFPKTTLSYKANNLSQSAVGQTLLGYGAVIQKNANGPLLTSTGDNARFVGLLFKGDAATPAFTGDNIVSTGEDPTFISCGSMWAYGRALKAQGNHVTVIGSAPIYQTADATASGYDLEIGKSGTNTGYHELHGVKTSQATGGFLFIDTGEQHVLGGQFGKLYLQNATSQAAANGGSTTGARILGNVTVELSGARFVSNAFGLITVTFALGTSGCSLDETNTFINGAVIVNNGNANNVVRRNISTGSYAQIRWGDDSSSAYMQVNQAAGGKYFRLTGLQLPNNLYLTFEDSGGTPQSVLAMDGSGNVLLNSAVANAVLALQTAGASSRVQFSINGNARFNVDAKGPYLPTFTVATRPASPSTGTVIFVSDGGAGAVFQGWNGVAWVNLG